MTNAAVVSSVLSFLIAVIIAPILIPILHRLKFGQEIREIGPKWHQKKSGTPTMGGFIFIIPFAVCMMIFARNPIALCVLLFSLSFALIGFLDDYIKVYKKRNLGLTEKQKFLFQLLFSALFIAVSVYWLELIDTSIILPFAGSFDIGVFYIPLALFVLIGCTNSVNLTDGVDGLASSVTIVVCCFLSIIAKRDGYDEISIANLILAAALLGFLLFNRHPAKVFMGDTGSLFLGAAVCSSALLMKNPLILIVAGGVYVIETLSVILQVASFKLTGKRIFKMSPIHHHFEMCGWSEKKIVLTAVLISAILCALAYLI